MKIRRYYPGEEEALWSLLYNTVHKINVKDYSQAQINAWAPDEWDMEQWKKRLAQTNPFVSEIDGQLVGFTELEKNGHIDCFYCDHRWQQKGIGSSLLKAIEAEAARQGISCLFAEASITARGFFEKMGFSVEGEQVVILRGEEFNRFRVSKCISS